MHVCTETGTHILLYTGKTASDAQAASGSASSSDFESYEATLNRCLWRRGSLTSLQYTSLLHLLRLIPSLSHSLLEQAPIIPSWTSLPSSLLVMSQAHTPTHMQPCCVPSGSSRHLFCSPARRYETTENEITVCSVGEKDSLVFETSKGMYNGKCIG